MDMNVFVGGKKERVLDSELLGEGGEARVYRLGELALKLFHPPTDAKGRRGLGAKVEKLKRFPLGLPAAVMAPRGLALDRDGEVVGYVMGLVANAQSFGRLSSRKVRDGAMTASRVVALFKHLHATLSRLHAMGVVVGDLNDGNVLFSGDEAVLIDADSMQFGAFPCLLGHERFLDPRLYGVDLAQAPRFTPGSDWYAYSVMLFSSLLCVHPFGGTQCAGVLPTLLRRAEARHSVLRGDVTLPRLALPPAALPDDLLHFFEAVFEHDERAAFPAGLLELSFHRCACGVEHARAVCPACRVLGPLVTRPVLRSKGRCTARTVFETSGRILAATLSGGLRYVYEEDGVVRREDGSIACASRREDQVFAVQGRATWVADGEGRVEKVEAGRVVERARTERRLGRPVLCATSQASYRQEQAWLVEQSTGARVGQVLEGQTWLWTGDRLGLGFYRVGGLTVAFLLRTGRAGLKRLEGVGWEGRVVEAEAVFDLGHALLSVVTEFDGKERTRRWLFDETGALVAASPDGVRGHATLSGGRVVVATDAGLVGLKADSGFLVEAVSFPDSMGFVSAGDELLANSDGSLYIVGARDIVQLTLSSEEVHRVVAAP